jgi:hypothetical protein
LANQDPSAFTHTADRFDHTGACVEYEAVFFPSKKLVMEFDFVKIIPKFFERKWSNDA